MKEPIQVIIVDDDEEDIEIVRRHLSDSIEINYHIISYTTPAHFQENFPTQKGDLILLDYLLGGDTGLSMLKWIKSVSDCPVIILTGHGDERIAVEIMRNGADDYLIKNELSPDILRRTLREVHHRSLLQKEKRKIEQDLKTSEARYRNVVEKAGDCIVVVQNESLNYVNPRFADMLGYTVKELTNRPFHLYFSPESLLQAGKLQEEMHSPENPTNRVFEMTLKHRSGKIVEVEMSSCGTLVNNQPAVIYILRDITERKQFLRGILKAKKAAELANKTKNDFLSVISHELRTPLTSILGFTELVAQRENRQLSRESQTDLKTILKNGKHLLHLIDQILHFKAIESGRLIIKSEPCRLFNLLKDTYQTIKPLLSQKSIRFEMEIAKQLPWVTIDPVRLKQILLNILENSIKFTEKGSIRISLPSFTQESKSFIIRISDTGIGIPKNKLQTIFRKFEQGDTGSTRKYGGTGLGLSISNSIIELMGGTISVQSRQGKGTNFLLTLPFQPATETIRNKKTPVLSGKKWPHG
ncbi:MAG: hypothetical protein A2293_15600 [Elusimicrobia bacterium RIFOXYB2_FULL_49_7]|nr:MAG: hypothetical protein A2293_15600 [Elusimicrobia bacterium RIFOXYB2_FULL_49_7]